MCHCGGVDVHHHHGSTKYNKILDKISEKRKKTYLVGARDVSHLESPAALVIPSLSLPWWWCVHCRHCCSCTCSLIIKKFVSRAYKKKKDKNLPRAQDADSSQAPAAVAAVSICQGMPWWQLFVWAFGGDVYSSLLS